MRPSHVSERLFERYLAERGYTWVYEAPNPEGGRRPDYFVDTPAGGVVCELKAFGSGGRFELTGHAQVGSRSMQDVLAPLRSDLREAARQLKGARGTGLPLIAVLSNPLGLIIPTEPSMVMAAMYGDPTMQAPVRDDGSLGDFTMIAGRNGRLTNDHQYISAVAVLHVHYRDKDWARAWIAANRAAYTDDASGLIAGLMEASQTEAPGGDDVRVDVIETLSDDAVALPREIFDGPLDRRFAPNADGCAIVALS